MGTWSRARHIPVAPDCPETSGPSAQFGSPQFLFSPIILPKKPGIPNTHILTGKKSPCLTPPAGLDGRHQAQRIRQRVCAYSWPGRSLRSCQSLAPPVGTGPGRRTVLVVRNLLSQVGREACVPAALRSPAHLETPGGLSGLVPGRCPCPGKAPLNLSQVASGVGSWPCTAPVRGESSAAPTVLRWRASWVPLQVAPH